MSERLKMKPCPFCGGEPQLFNIFRNNAGTFDSDSECYIECSNCGARTMSLECCPDTNKDVIQDWNRRASVPNCNFKKYIPEGTSWACSHCHGMLSSSEKWREAISFCPFCGAQIETWEYEKVETKEGETA